MNRDEIMNMRPGVEMDELIAETIFGCELRDKGSPYHRCVSADHVKPSYYTRTTQGSMAGPLVCPYGKTENDGQCTIHSIQNYSTTLMPVWKVVEKLKDDGLHFVILDVIDSPEWMARFHTAHDPAGGPTKDVYARSPHELPALAICRAALLTTLDTT